MACQNVKFLSLNQKHMMKHSETLTFYPSKLKYFLLLIGSILLTLAGIWITNETSLGWFVIIFFGICGIVLIVGLLPNASYLRISDKGFEICSLFKSVFINWTEVTQFGSQYFGPKKMVIFNYTPGHPHFETARRIAKNLIGTEGALPDTYGKSADELAKLLNEWKGTFTQKHG